MWLNLKGSRLARSFDVVLGALIAELKEGCLTDDEEPVELGCGSESDASFDVSVVVVGNEDVVVFSPGFDFSSDEMECLVFCLLEGFDPVIL